MIRFRSRRKTYISMACSVLLTQAFLVACFKNSPAQDPIPSVQISFNPQRPVVGVSTVKLILPEQIELAEQTIRIEANMTHPGMTPTFAILQPQESKLTFSGPIEFSMAGDWVLSIDLKMKDKGATQLIERVYVQPAQK